MHRVPLDCQIPRLSEIYAKYLPEKGIFVEVGAYDGETYSNTCLLADDGWTFIYVEPIDSHYEKCRERHKDNNGAVIKALAGDGTSKLIYEAGEWTTGLKSATEEVNKHWGVRFAEPINIQSKTLNRILEGVSFEEKIDLLVVDTEGSELEILQHFDFEKYSPTMCIIEMHEQWHPVWHTPEHIVWLKKLNDLMYSKGYLKIHTDQINTIFVK